MTRLWLGIRALILGLFGTAMLLSATEYHYSYLPKHVYPTQVFPVTILAGNARANQPVEFHFDSNTGQKPLSISPAKVINGRDLFYTFYFQANGEDDVAIPAITIRENNQSHSLPSQHIHTQAFTGNVPHDFCGLIASDCSLQTSQLSTFDTNTTLVTITLRAHEGNPEAIHIPGALEEGIEKLTRRQAVVTAEYYFVIPSTQKSITLSYYNTVQHRFIPTTILTDYQNKPVAAQVELNPKANHFDQLKKYGSIALVFFFIIMFLWQRDRLYLILLILILAVTILIYQPHNTLCIQEGSSLYILPTPNSRSSTTITEKLKTPSLGEHGKYFKINYRHGTIGWIRHEDLCKN